MYKRFVLPKALNTGGEYMKRESKIIQTSIVGITVNVILVAFKAFIGLAAHSIAITTDAVNNLGDAFSSVITIIGTKLSLKKADKKHPFGYGRIEYFTSAFIGIVVLAAGLSSAKESVNKIIHPSETFYSFTSLIIIFAAVLVKFFAGLYIKKTGKAYNAKVLENAGTDSIMDSAVSLTTLIAALLNVFFRLKFEGLLGALISILVIKSGFEMLLETTASLIGTRADQELAAELKRTIRTYEGVNGAYDLVLHNYGPSSIIGTVHIEVNDSFTAREIHKLTRTITKDIYVKYGIVMTIGIYASNQSNELCRLVSKTLGSIAGEYKEIVQYHGLYVDEKSLLISFDLVIDFECSNPQNLIKEVEDKMKKTFPLYSFSIQHDVDYSL